jgi:putative ABC transport system ATP-binding protein
MSGKAKVMTRKLFERAGFDVNVVEIHKTYRVAEDAYQALQGVTCRMPRGQVTIVQGPSGCGKSTLLNMLSGIDHPDRGVVSVSDRALTEVKSERELAHFRLHEVGFVFQAFNLIPGLTAMQNLRLPMTVAGWSDADQGVRAEGLLDLVGMVQKKGKRPDALSGGEQQRVAVALALANDPPMILADEPTGNLDTANARRVTDLLCSLAHEFNKTVVITTHDLMVAERGDQVLHMRDGKFVTP